MTSATPIPANDRLPTVFNHTTGQLLTNHERAQKPQNQKFRVNQSDKKCDGVTTARTHVLLSATVNRMDDAMKTQNMLQILSVLHVIKPVE